MELKIHYFDQITNDHVFLFVGNRSKLIQMLEDEGLLNEENRIVHWDHNKHGLTLFIKDKSKATLLKLKY